jgi:hypothetical protein
MRSFREMTFSCVLLADWVEMKNQTAISQGVLFIP